MDWIFRMAWRDSRGSRRHLALFLSSMVVGVAALVAIGSFGTNLELAVDAQSKSLLGADLSLESDDPFGPDIEALIDSLGGDQSRQVSFASMAYFPNTGDTRLATIRAVEGDYPYYGRVETTPRSAASVYLARGQALVDATLTAQFDIQPGDSVRVGNQTYVVAGRIDKTPRENEIMSLVSPRVYIPLADIDSSLLGPGSRAEYEVYFRFEPDRDVEAMVEQLEPRLRDHGVGFDTVEEIRENWDESLTNLYRFLSVVAFIAVLLGGIGVASSIHVYVRRRIETIAILRCLGAPARKTFGVYLVQAGGMGIVGGVLGSLLGIAIQTLVPLALRDFLPVEVPTTVSYGAIGTGLVVGAAVTLIFALLPLVGIRKVSPLLTLRSTVDRPYKSVKDPVWWMILAGIAVGMGSFAVLNAPEPVVGIVYTIGLGLVFLALLGMARVVMWAARRFFPQRWTYPWRQGLANLFRPNNQTSTLMLSLGLGTFLLATLFGVQATLLRQIEIAGGAGRPNLVLFDIQPDQVEPVTELVRDNGMPVIDRVPIVTMRISEVNGRTIDALREDSTVDLTWAHRREYRSTYRDYLTDSEIVTEGQFVGTMSTESASVPVSVEREIATELNVTLGDTLVFDVQGRPVTTHVASIREVDWRRFATNFFVVFPEGVLEDAPQFWVLLSRADSQEQSSGLQRAVVQAFPSISSIDLSLIISTFDEIFGRISFVIRFMASFSIITGLIVLVGAVVVSRLQRVRESVLLKTLGASRRQVFGIMLAEYLLLGLLAALTGLLLSVASGWAFAAFLFETTFRPDLVAMLVMLVIVPVLTAAIGLLNSRGVYARTPLEILRAEV